MLSKVPVKANDEPDKLFEQLGEAQNCDSNGSVDEADLMAVVLTASPVKHQSVLPAVQSEKEGTLKLGDLEEAMDQVWRQSTDVNKKDDKDELALTPQDGGGSGQQQKKKNF